jgi:rod shape-determining protein MreD
MRKLRFAVCALVLFVVQTAIVHRFTHRFLRPDLLYAMAAFLALEADFRSALWGGFALGMLRDLGASGRLGGSALLIVLATAGLLFLRDRLLRESFVTDLVLTFAYVLVCGTAHAFATALLAPGHQSAELIQRAFGQAMFTTAVSPLLFASFTKAGLVDRKIASAADAA